MANHRHYIPGFTGLDIGSQLLPSITLAVPLYFCPTDTIKDDHGKPQRPVDAMPEQRK